ncbi:unnamed protein product [Gongylonema pulchrum]|uniref:Vta1 domain-containing protein n=1 Tax=Gongylonema pulchrum TaxID=637853 RepID=A0A183D3A9_9BILA|nr:unnamed protein product [Gongylonema pulchrum]
MAIDKKSPEALQYLTSLLSTLENMKKNLVGQEALSQDMVAQAHIENFAMKLFEYADKNDRQSNFTKGVIKAFYTAGHLIDVLTLFGELDENLTATRKYAKWKATYIHNCLKNGETPKPGPAGSGGDPAAASGGTPSSDHYNRPAQPHVPPNVPQEKPFTPPRVCPERPPAGGMAETFETAGGPSAESTSSDTTGLTVTDFLEAQKYAKYAVSALSYEDAKTAIECMTKALEILKKQ